MTLASHETMPVAHQTEIFSPQQINGQQCQTLHIAFIMWRSNTPAKLPKTKNISGRWRTLIWGWGDVAVCREVQSEFLCRPERSELGMCWIGHYPLSEDCVDGRHTRHERRVSCKGGWAWANGGTVSRYMPWNVRMYSMRSICLNR